MRVYGDLSSERNSGRGVRRPVYRQMRISSDGYRKYDFSGATGDKAQRLMRNLFPTTTLRTPLWLVAGLEYRGRRPSTV